MEYHATTLNMLRELKYNIPFQVHIIFLQDMKRVGGRREYLQSCGFLVKYENGNTRWCWVWQVQKERSHCKILQ